MGQRRAIAIEWVEEHLRAWLRENADASMIHEAEALPLRCDMVTLLSFVRDGKVVGTQATGNMPLKAIREVTSRFVNPPALETAIGDKIYPLRSEAELWPLYFLHILAEVGHLLKAGRTRRWRVTAQGERFLDTGAMLQVPFLLAVWWYRVNWIVAYPFEGMGRRLPPFFSRFALASLRYLPTEAYIPFEEFADQLIARTRLRWGVQDRRIATIALHGAIRAMVIDRLADFGVLERQYRREAIGSTTVPKFVEFKITPWGEALLDALSAIGSRQGTKT